MNRRALLIGAGAAACALGAPAARAQSQRLGSAAQYSAERGGAALLAARHGIVLFEHYPGGLSREARWPIGRGTRVLAAVLAAALIDDRLMSLDEFVVGALPEWGGHPLKQSISVRVLLSGAGGLSFGPRDANDTTTALMLEPAGAPGVSYSDDAAPFVLLAEIARRKLVAAGRWADPAEYLFSRVLEPIGCGPVQWSRGPDGAARFDDGAALSARDWAQIGELIRRDGVWRAQQLIDMNAVREAQRGSFAQARVGFGLYLAGAGAHGSGAPGIDSDVWRANPLPADLAMAAGAGGQRLYIVPSQNLVIVRMSRSPTGRDWSDAEFLSLMLRGL